MTNERFPRVRRAITALALCLAAPVASAAPADINADGRVDTLDLMDFLESYRSGAPLSNADLNRDGAVDAADLGVLLEGFGESFHPTDGEHQPNFIAALVGDGTKLELTDNATGFKLVDPTATKLWTEVSGSTNPCLVTPSIALVPHTDGCDLVFTYVNNTQEWSGLGKITLAGVRLDEQITGHDFRFDGKPITLNADNSGIGVSGWYYPGGTYSPVNVIEDGPYKMGVSLLYPILNFKHQVRIRCKAQFPSGGGAAWFHEFVLNPEHENKYNPGGDLAPGETRSYILAVRVVKNHRPWQESLEPYRDYFQSRHGAVDYARNNAPAQFTTLAVDGNHDIENPYSFAGGYNFRPDLFGFGPWVDRLVTRADRGYQRIMVSKPTGHFFINIQNNIPPLFTSHWLEGADYGHNMADAFTQFPRIPAAGVNLGLWWGRSAQVMPDGWDTFAIEDLDPNNPEHAALGFREIDAAYAAGARLIGLDAFRRMQAWDALRWIQMMRVRAPAVRFITEPVCGDIVHNRYPAFQVATRPQNEAELRVETRHYLADLLNPGHETWGYARIDRLTDYLGREPTLEDWIAEAERIASLGYIVCLSEPINVLPSMYAVESWHEDQ